MHFPVSPHLELLSVSSKPILMACQEIGSSFVQKIEGLLCIPLPKVGPQRACLPYPRASPHTVLTECCLDSYGGGPGIQGVDCPGMSHPFIRTHTWFSWQQRPPGRLAIYFALDAMAQAHRALPHAPSLRSSYGSVVGEARQPLSGQVCAPGTY